MNKTELFDKVAAAAGLSKPLAKASVEAAFAAIKEAVAAGDKVQLLGFGTFAAEERPARECINPRDPKGPKILCAAKKVVKFKAGAEFADALN